MNVFDIIISGIVGVGFILVALLAIRFIYYMYLHLSIYINRAESQLKSEKRGW